MFPLVASVGFTAMAVAFFAFVVLRAAAPPSRVAGARSAPPEATTAVPVAAQGEPPDPSPAADAGVAAAPGSADPPRPAIGPPARRRKAR